MGKPQVWTVELIFGMSPNVTGWVPKKKVGSATVMIARSQSWPTNFTCAGYRWAKFCFLTSIYRWLATLWAFVRMRLPSITKPEPSPRLMGLFFQGVV